MKTDLTTLTFVIKPSRYLALLLTGLHILAVLAVLSAHIQGILQILLILLTGLHFSVLQRNVALQSTPRILTYTETLGWQLISGQSKNTIEIQPSTVITTFLIIIHYRCGQADQAVHSLVCVKDALSAGDFKQLFVQLKIAGLQNNHPKK